ncbi:Holliday junction branch migration protein RuvA [Rubellicoccus peritrichatus]|uniref:Holliday junction branch migration complex subunit RuvA n=1 Tax=Rubellicoccus peritrichatus TaxID=3080537 RepID=A0AAQ3QTB2_9BACT|nr:Holliday junction branch migration protein RuvA [Puniceicoccus sp. CR14]WOO43523.1 Holliday junction branch migration protein RuvA [Puniceicoccus sp. CR14]
MIVTISGKLIEATPLQAIIETGGIGYEVNIPVTTAERLPDIGATVRLHTLSVYREDSATLFGFAEREERDFFRLLVEKVSGVGPRIALSIMSRLSLTLLRGAIMNGDAALLSKCPGIGKKTAERLIIELRDKIGAVSVAPTGSSSTPVTGAAAPSAQQDAIDALMALGYKPADADKAVRKAVEAAGKNAATEELVRLALS